MKKVYDLAVKVGTYVKDGIEKGRYENVGAVMENDDGGKFLFLKRCFNPAGVPHKDGSESIIVSMFKPKSGSATTDNAPDEPAPGGEEIPW